MTGGLSGSPRGDDEVVMDTASGAPAEGAEVASEGEAEAPAAEAEGTSEVVEAVEAERTTEAARAVAQARTETLALKDSLIKYFAEFLAELMPSLASYIYEALGLEMPADEATAVASAAETQSVTLEAKNEPITDPDAIAGLVRITNTNVLHAPSFSDNAETATKELAHLKTVEVTNIVTVGEGTNLPTELDGLTVTSIAIGDSIDYATLGPIAELYESGNLLLVGAESRALGLLLYAINNPGIEMTQLLTDHGLDANALSPSETSLLSGFCENQATIRVVNSGFMEQMEADEDDAEEETA